jgi:glycosidase
MGGTPDAGAIQSADASVGPAPQNGAAWWRDDVFYEVFVRSYADSNGDGIGDFRGLQQKLDVLNDGDSATRTDLGVDGLWLMPIFASPSYHGYDVVDYRAVNPDYGTLADFDALIAAAHARGIRVVLDFVLNHSSSEHPYFLDAKSGENAVHRRRYLFRGDDPGWKQPFGSNPVWHRTGNEYYYGVFWSGMPDWNLADPAVEIDLIDAMRFWLARGVDGFRIDAARHLFESATGDLSDQPQSHAFIKRARAALSAEYPEVLLIAEAWTSLAQVAPYYGDADEFHLAFGFDTAAAIKTSAGDGNRADLNQHVSRLRRTYRDSAFEAPFLANHDMQRVMAILRNDRAAMRVAAAALIAMPGTPFVYYGEELGMIGGPTTKDEDKRTPMPWNGTAPGFGFTTGTSWYSAAEAAGVDVESQRNIEGSLWSLFRDLIALRHGQRALTHGDISQPALTGGGKGTAGILRSSENQKVLFIANFDRAASAPVEIAVSGVPRVLLSEGLSDAPQSRGELLSLGAMNPQSYAFIALE